MADVLCPICGKQNSEHREFCDFCGNPLDGALRVEGDSGSAGDNLLGTQGQDFQDDASRLDSLVPAPGEETQPSQQDGEESPELPQGASRLASLLSDQDHQTEEPPPGDPKESDLFNGGSRLDDYLPVEETPISRERQDFTEDESSRLDDYLAPEEPSDDSILDFENLSETHKDDAARLDDYLGPESPQEQEEPDEVSRLDDFFADDPFTSPDPFQESTTEKTEEVNSLSTQPDPFAEPARPEGTTAPADQDPAEEPLFLRDDLFSDSSSEPASKEPDPSPPGPGVDEPGDFKSADSPESVDWDFLDPTPAPEDQPAETIPESVDPGQWDFLDPTPAAEPTQEESQTEDIDAGDWDFLDPVPEDPEAEISPESIDAGEWDYLDPSPTTDQPEEEKSDQPPSADEWDFLDPSPEPEQTGDEISPASSETEEWDFLDPSPAPSDQEPVGASPQPEESESQEDWSFLDPGPTADLGGKESEPEYSTEGDEEDAGWLDMLQDPGSRQIPEPEPEPKKPQTDWLDKIKRLNKSSDLVDEDSSFPDWLSVTGKTAEFAGDASAEGAGSPDQIPDWLQLDDDESLNEFLRRKDLSNEEYKPKITTDSLDEEEDIDITEEAAPADEPKDSQHIKFPSWADQQKAKEQQHRDPQAAADQAETPEEPIEPFQVEEEHFDDLFSDELPGWLTEASSEEIRQSLGDDLAQGELPGWVEAMRPVVESTGASGLDEDEEYIENYGPLAGIPSVLPAEAEIGIDVDEATQKPLDLLATKNHQKYVDLLKKLIGDENKSKTILLPPPIQTQRVLRWLMAIVVLVVVGGTLIFSGAADMQSPATTQIQSAGFNALYEEIDNLYDGQPVLIAFDYQPASSGELHTAAATVVDHLMEEGTFLSFISTQPTGPALAEHFLDTTQSQHGYIHTQKYINLGYLPGDSAGLLSFMINPERIIPLAFDGSNAWDSPPLISIEKIDDFKMVLVITDDPDKAKIWIEQVGPRLNKTPLTMVVSAQVEPLIKPYFRTSPQQLNGYVAGIIDSINYEKLSERPNLATKIWLPFNMGVLISVGIIFISGMANGVLSLFARRKEEARGESK